MYLSRLGSDISSGIKADGERLYWRNRVRIQRGNLHEVNAEVEDGHIVYNVRLNREGRNVLASCQCPAAVDLGVCAHIWAALLQSERKSYLGGNFSDGLPEVLASIHALNGLVTEKGTWSAAFHMLKPLPVAYQYGRERDVWPLAREIRYVINPARMQLGGGGGLCMDLQVRDPKKDGSFGKTKSVALYRRQVDDVPDRADREIFTLLSGVPSADQYQSDHLPSSYSLSGPAGRRIAALIVATGRCFLQENETPLQWADGDPFEFRISVDKDDKFWTLEGALKSPSGRSIALQDLRHTAGGLFVTETLIGPMDTSGSSNWLEMMRKNPKLTAPLANGLDLLAQVMSRDDHPPFDWHPDLEFQQLRTKPVPWLVIREAGPGFRLHARANNNNMAGVLTFLYGSVGFRYGHLSKGTYAAAQRAYIHCDPVAEAAAVARMRSLRLRPIETWVDQIMVSAFEIPRKRIPEVVSHLAGAGWRVEVEGKLVRQSSGFSLSISSEIDWFDLEGGLEFGATEIVRMPALLKALRRGETMVELSDGSFGVVPDNVRERFASLLQMAHTDDGKIRFRRNQAGMLDVLLSQRPEITFDEGFTQARAEVRAFERVEAAEQPAGFVGTLRDYQREGVGWMQFLRRLGMGGCLADDMGVGKTPQMLALLETRRVLRPEVPPSLAVVPRSLVYNWMQEAARFTPGLRVLDHTGADRSTNWDHLNDFDLVLSTYGTLRRDAAEFRNFEFDYVILDEAQNIKNATSESAKAARLLNGRNRMVLTGTPIENHLGELWSLIEFLNPGMMGAGVFQTAGASLRNPDPETRTMLARALRPFILRRTKEQVARELPPKVEQTVYCELEGEQKKLYNELRDHYRQTLLGKIDAQGIGKSKLQILEALLRLRQAACHPGLIDTDRRSAESAKLETLMDQLESVVSEGHKALVFSQFTSLLSIVCERLNDAGIVFEYLDGRTRDRQSRVERFQTDPGCRVFLISLKAGGVGLNLTAADYVFLLDPWWNPAVEAQAVDRAHRIGQSKQVFSYRLIARDTVEEKVLLLQQHKKDLADAIIQADAGMVKSLQREDLEILLS